MVRRQKIGVFDSGLGGLFIAQAIQALMPEYDYLYLGDTLNLPYGRRSDEAIYHLSENVMRYLFAQDCALIIMACNTASAAALRRLQQGYLLRERPNDRILGVVVPTLDVAIEQGAARIGLIGTERTVRSGIYDFELKKINPAVEMTSVATPLLVPLIEHQGEKYLCEVLKDYLAPMIEANIQSLILGCTHYVALKDLCAKILGDGVQIISQDDIIPIKLKDYLKRHPEMEQRLSQDSSFAIHTTDINESFIRNIFEITGSDQATKAVF